MRAVNTDDPVTYQKLDYDPDSLIPLGHWFSKHVHTLEKTSLEIRREIERLDPRFRAHSNKVISDWKWSAETISLCFDIGIYLAKIFQQRFENVKWTYITEPSDYVYRNMPVLEGFRVHLSPYDLVRTVAVKIHKGKEGSANELKRTFDVWMGEHIAPGLSSGVYARKQELS